MASDALLKFTKRPLLMGKVVMPGMFSVKSPAFHYTLEADYLDFAQQFINTIAPRGHAKSSIVAGAFALHHLFLMRPFLKGAIPFVLLQSKTGPHAERLLSSIKDVITYSEPFRAYFGYHGREVARKWREDTVILDTGEIIVSRGTGQQVVGLKIGDQRPTFIISDDPEDMENTKTPAALRFNMAWFLQQLVPCRDPRVGRVFVIGTPQAETCIVETLSKSTTWRTRRYQALADEVEKDLELQERILRGEVKAEPWMSLWPEWWPADKLIQEKKMMEENFGVSAFYREYQCKLIGTEEALIRPEDIQWYEGTLRMDAAGIPYLEFTEKDEVVERRPVSVFMGMDFATSTGRHADYTWAVCVAVDRNMNRFVLPYRMGRWAPSVTVDIASTLWKANRPVRLNIETSGQQETFADMIREKSRDDQMLSMIIITHKPRDSKEKRYLQILEPLFKAKKMFLHKKAMGELEAQLLAFRLGENHGHDDGLDALYYANYGAFAPSHDSIILPASKREHVREVELDPMTR